MAKWELADSIVVSPNKQELAARPLPGVEETVAETRDKNGTIIGRWVVKWGENGQGTCHQVGRVVRCAFNFCSSLGSYAGFQLLQCT